MAHVGQELTLGDVRVFRLFFQFERGLLTKAIACFTATGALALIIASDSKTALALMIMAPAIAISIYLSSRLLAIGPAVASTLVIGLCVSGFVMISAATGFSVEDLMLVTYGDATFTGRTDIWSFIYTHIQQSPILGNGFRGFWSLGGASPKHGSEIEFIRTIGSGHNGFLDVTLDLGIVGLALLLAMIYAGFRAAGRIDVRPLHITLFYLSMILFSVGRNMMESVILWSTFFDNLSFLLVCFLACYNRPIPAMVMQPGSAAVGAPARRAA